ncbi:MAG: MAPEG family protein [Alphaproteobacteria bacterium]
MTQQHQQIVLVSVFAICVYLWTCLRVAGARRKYGVLAPAISGDPVFDRHVRVQTNTLEWLPVFLAALWMASLYWAQTVAALLGLLWPLARIFYAVAYVNDPAKRSPGFGLQAASALGLLLLAMIGAVQAMMVTGGV